MKKRLFLLLFGALTIGSLSQCQDPLEGIEIKVGTNVLDYTLNLQINDGNGNAVSGLNVEITGQDAASIYNLAGEKNFTVSGGILGLGVHPKAEPLSGKPVMFSVVLSGADYITQVVPVSISEGEFQSVKTVSIAKKEATPEGVSIISPTVGVENGAISGEKTISTSTENSSSNQTNITLPDGTTFQDEDGNVITGDVLRAVLMNLDPAKPSALKVFPGGSLTSDNVITEGGTQATSGSFLPAGMVSIEFFLGNSQIRRFGKPIKIAMELDANFENVETGAKLKAGDRLGVYSYQTTSGQWQFEKNVTVENINGKMVANFETDHLTWYMVGNFLASCIAPTTINLSADWMEEGITYPLHIEAFVAGKAVYDLQVSASKSNLSFNLRGMPAGGDVYVKVSTPDGQVLSGTDGHLVPKMSCGAAFTIPLSAPETNLPKVTLQLYVRCPNTGDLVTVLPTFYMYYRESGSATGDDGYKFLGTVTRGFLSTTLLTAGDTEYDFVAVWSDKVKKVNNKKVTVDNSATVGTGPGDIIGEKEGAVNLQMLTEMCR